MISTVEDGFIKNYKLRNPRWVIHLNDGTTVFQDDGRYDPPNAWTRLKIHCEENQLYIVRMHVQNRSNVKRLPSNMDGYSFTHGIRGVFGGHSTKLFFTGWLSGGIITVQKWRVPEMVLELEEVRSLEQVESVLIEKP